MARIVKAARPDKMRPSDRARKAPRKPRKPFPWAIVVAIVLAGILGLACSLRMAGA